MPLEQQRRHASKATEPAMRRTKSECYGVWVVPNFVLHGPPNGVVAPAATGPTRRRWRAAASYVAPGGAGFELGSRRLLLAIVCLCSPRERPICAPCRARTLRLAEAASVFRALLPAYASATEARR